jgi:hypothetical protein
MDHTKHEVDDIAIDDLYGKWDFICRCTCGATLTREDIMTMNGPIIAFGRTMQSRDPKWPATYLAWYDRVHKAWENHE